MIEIIFFIFIFIGFFIDSKVDTHLKVYTNSLRNIGKNLKFGFIIYRWLLVAFIVVFYDYFYSYNGNIILNTYSIPLVSETSSIYLPNEKFPSLHFYEIMSHLFLGIFVWCVKITMDRKGKYLSCLFSFFIGYCLLSGIIFIEGINYYTLKPALFDKLAIKTTVQGILLHWIILMALMGFWYASRTVKDVHSIFMGGGR